MEIAEIRVLTPADAADLEVFLLSCLESSMFLISNMRRAGLVDRGEPYQGTYAAAWEGARITATAGHFWNQVICLQAPVHLDRVWRAAAEASGRPVKGLIGPSDQVEAVFSDLGIESSEIQMDEPEILYGLDLDRLVLPQPLVSGEVAGRRMELDDVDLMVEWRVAYAVETLGERESPELWANQRTSVERALNESSMWVLERDGRRVACSAFNAEIEEAVQVGGVYTPPEFRGRGYARAAVAASLLDARERGVSKAILFTGIENRPAQKAYEALGFEAIGTYRILMFREPVAVSGR